MRKRDVVIIVLLILLGVLGFGANYLYRENLSPVSNKAQTQYFTIAPGTSSAEIGAALERAGLVRNGQFFRLYARLVSKSSSMQAGFYSLSSSQSTPEILEIITEGQVANIAVRIPEGVTLMELEAVLVKAGYTKTAIAAAWRKNYSSIILRDKPNSSSLEGYLFPDTYHIAANAPVEELIMMILANTERKLDDQLVAAWGRQGLNIHQAVTLASIVEKEASEPDEQAMVAQVFLSRIRQGQKLEADPTYLFGAKLLGRAPSPSLDSPYNTYKVEGLPPGPIANPALPAMQAVANPAETDFVYFVTGTDGVTRFSRRQAEHDAKVKKFGVSGVE